MQLKFVPGLMSLTLLTACTANLTMQPPRTTASEKPERAVVASAKPSASPSVTPSVQPSVAASATPTPAVEIELPTTIRPSMPASVIATGGLNLIGQAGGNLIGQAGGNLIGQAGGNYALLQTGAVAISLAKYMKVALGLYVDSTFLVDLTLSEMRRHKLVPGVPYTGISDHPLLPGQELTGLLERTPDGLMLSVGFGKEAKGPQQIVSLKFSSPRRGSAIFHGVMLPERPYIVTTFDLDAGTATAEGFRTSLTGDRVASRWEFKTYTDAPDGKTFSARVSRGLHSATDPNLYKHFGMAMNFLGDGTAAGIVGWTLTDREDEFLVIPRDADISGDYASKRTDVYVAADGKDLTAEPSAGLKAIVPKPEDILRPFPEVPAASYKPESDPRFVFPE